MAIYMSMKCPNCSGIMQEVQKHGVHVDYCPACKGVWLDRGEIDKILQSSTVPSAEVTGPSHDYELKGILAELRREGRIS
ncbi:MAG: zf-TFIIB domain-containing protein [Nitrososphaera sp.]|nr:zf-TFIIB domain-containing protein [Nitrososphaera sp.]